MKAGCQYTRRPERFLQVFLTDISIHEHSFRSLSSFGIAVRRHPRIRPRGNHTDVVGIRRPGVGAGDLVGRVDMSDLFADVEFAE